MNGTGPGRRSGEAQTHSSRLTPPPPRRPCGFEPADNESADRFSSGAGRWRCWTRCCAACARNTPARQRELFEQLKPILTETSRGVRYAAIAPRLGSTEGAVKVAAASAPAAISGAVARGISETVASEAEIDDEIRNLFAALSGWGAVTFGRFFFCIRYEFKICFNRKYARNATNCHAGNAGRVVPRLPA